MFSAVKFGHAKWIYRLRLIERSGCGANVINFWILFAIWNVMPNSNSLSWKIPRRKINFNHFIQSSERECIVASNRPSDATLTQSEYRAASRVFANLFDGKVKTARIPPLNMKIIIIFHLRVELIAPFSYHNYTYIIHRDIIHTPFSHNNKEKLSRQTHLLFYL